MEPIRTSILSHTALNLDMRSILQQSGLSPCRVIFGVCTWMVGFRRFRIPGTSLIPVSVAPFLMALNPSSRHRTSHLQWHLQCCKFPCFRPPPPKKKKRQSSSNAWCAKIWASSRACHKMHEEQVVKSEHSLGQRILASQQPWSRDSFSDFFQKKRVLFFTLSCLHSRLKYFWIEDLSQTSSVFGSFTFLLYVRTLQSHNHGS